MEKDKHSGGFLSASEFKLAMERFAQLIRQASSQAAYNFRYYALFSKVFNNLKKTNEKERNFKRWGRNNPS